ncbi:MAG: deoxyribose-phosphate aldolase [Halobacteriovoraceae bacterium]|nr:deoxyribose-phosphate aldolase [Halobacteriovoraceae bacterium]|tara:strand:- start:3405 stop:4073 length:669 start_codon:yes stop_codon:yes gene_type:complete
MQLNTYIDHTLLKPEATESDIERICAEAKQFNFKAVCINPCFVKLASKLLFGTEVGVCTVIGFPLGANHGQTKVFETTHAIADGADEIDMVVNIGDVKNGNFSKVEREIEDILVECKKSSKVLKVIFETCLLTNEEIIKLCEICKDLQVDFVKTSTGFSTGGATAEVVKLMKDTVGSDVGVKASGGVRSKEDALKMIEAGATRIGASSGVKIMQGEVSKEQY